MDRESVTVADVTAPATPIQPAPVNDAIVVHRRPTPPPLEEEGRDDLVQYADEQVTTGTEAEAYASFIDGHLQGIADGATYADLGSPQSEARAALAAAHDRTDRRDRRHRRRRLRYSSRAAHGAGDGRLRSARQAIDPRGRPTIRRATSVRRRTGLTPSSTASSTRSTSPATADARPRPVPRREPRRRDRVAPPRGTPVPSPLPGRLCRPSPQQQLPFRLRRRPCDRASGRPRPGPRSSRFRCHRCSRPHGACARVDPRRSLLAPSAPFGRRDRGAWSTHRARRARDGGADDGRQRTRRRDGRARRSPSRRLRRRPSRPLRRRHGHPLSVAVAGRVVRSPVPDERQSVGCRLRQPLRRAPARSPRWHR